MRHNCRRELIGILRRVCPAPRITGEHVPGVGNIRTREHRQQSVHGTPDGDDDDPCDAGAVRPCSLLEEPEKLEQLAQLDEGCREVEADVEYVEQDQVVPDVPEFEKQEVPSGSILDPCVGELTDVAATAGARGGLTEEESNRRDGGEHLLDPCMLATSRLSFELVDVQDRGSRRGHPTRATELP